MANRAEIAPRIYKIDQIEGTLILPPHLPPHMIEDADGLVRIRPEFVIEDSRYGPYDQVMDFGNTREWLKEEVPEGERLTASTPEIRVLGFEDQTIRNAMEDISTIANDRKKPPKKLSAKKEYKLLLATVYKTMANEALRWADGEEVAVYSPYEGGRFVQDIFMQAGFSKGDFFEHWMSRVQKTDGGLMVGIRLGENQLINTNLKRIIVADDCMASDISTSAALEMIKKAYEDAGSSLSEVDILLTYSIATQRGLQSILSPENRERLGFRSIQAIVGTLAFKLNDHYYLLKPDGSKNDDGSRKVAVGDMGEYTKK